MQVVARFPRISQNNPIPEKVRESPPADRLDRLDGRCFTSECDDEEVHSEFRDGPHDPSAFFPEKDSHRVNVLWHHHRSEGVCLRGHSLDARRPS